MKIPHSVALALVGWYLMVPPDSNDKAAAIATANYDYSQWETIDSFDSAADCQSVLRGVRGIIAHRLKKNFNVSADVPGIHSAIQHATSEDQLEWLKFAVGRLAAQCVASDDPRLKGK